MSIKRESDRGKQKTRRNRWGPSREKTGRAQYYKHFRRTASIIQNGQKNRGATNAVKAITGRSHSNIRTYQKEVEKGKRNIEHIESRENNSPAAAESHFWENIS